MTPKRVFLVCVFTAVAVSVASLFLWAAAWRIFITQSDSELLVMPVTLLCALVLAIGLALVPLGAVPDRAIKMLGVVVGGLAALVLFQIVTGVENGVERYVLGDETAAVFGGSSAGRPSPTSGLTVLFLAISLWFAARQRPPAFDQADVFASAALFLSFTILIANLYETSVDIASRQPGVQRMTLLESMLLFCLSTAVLAVKPNGVFGRLHADDPGGDAKRRMLPAAVLTPILLGFLLVYTQESGLLELSTALGLMVTSSIVVFVILIDRVSALISHIAEEQQGEFKERESKAMEVGMTDALTGLLNRRGWDQNLRAVEERCQAERLNSCVVVIDLDGLKRINDTLGHQQGDALIKRAATALRTAARRDDFLARLGGDEFAYLAVGCEPQHAGSVLRRLSQALEQGKVQASLGYAMRDLAGSLQAAFQEADQAMYAHKRERKARAAANA